MKKFFKILYLVVAVVTILEYLFVAGLFTAPIVIILTWAVGLVNLIFSLKDRDYNTSALYLLSTFAVTMGYWSLF